MKIELARSIFISGQLHTFVQVRSLTQDEKEKIHSTFCHAIDSNIEIGFVNERHKAAFISLVYLREAVVASIESIGPIQGPFEWEQICHVTAADWMVLTAAHMALDELAHGVGLPAHQHVYTH